MLLGMLVGPPRSRLEPRKGIQVKTHRHSLLRGLVSIASLFAALLVLTVSTRAQGGQADCAGCHEKDVHADQYSRSAHKDLTCAACHARDESKPLRPESKDACVATFSKPNCARCHENQAKQHQGSVHDGARLPIDCAKCHQDIHTIAPHKADKLAIAETCRSCHKRQQPYFESVHFEALKKGSADAPTCTDCHGLHGIAKVDNDAQGRELHTRACLKCHDDKAMMERNHVNTIAGATYFNSFHGKNVRLGYPEKVAGCADCHASHEVRRAEDPKSTVGTQQRVQTCQQCHANAGPSFAEYIAHAEDHDRKKSPALYWTRIFMTSLLVGTFFFFWLHSLLWAVRSFIDKQRKSAPAGAQAAKPHGTSAEEGTQKTYRRFRTTHIVLHIVVIVSFLTLALTGLPLKFSATSWSKAVMHFIGGTSRAQAIHHAAAIVTFGYFAVALVMSVRFLFSGARGAGGFRQRLFGPDSLFPNRRDLRDMKAMFRWFFFAGPKPTFERWTYWEKFDFMAVFWGMFAIGSSGLMLWFPEFFARFMPGWMFNIATIIHSDEALLATGFIFTVHFFNTHLRPEKFPMDVVIFNGRLTHEEMVAERGDQWQRYQDEGRVDELVIDGPTSIAWELGFRIFGMVAVAIGLSLAVAIVYALVAGG